MNKDTEITATVEKVTGEVIGTEFTSNERTTYKNLCEEIGKEVEKIDSAYLAIALKLHTIYQQKLYEIDNFANIYDMAYEKFMLGRATCNNYINICKEFGKFDKETNRCIGLLPQYEKFSSSKLVAMLRMSDELKKEITPDMSVREIKRRKKIFNERINSSEKSQEISTGSSSKLSTSSPKKQKLELFTTKDVDSVFDPEKNTLLEKIDKFQREHPDVDYYSIQITLIYED